MVLYLVHIYVNFSQRIGNKVEDSLTFFAVVLFGSAAYWGCNPKKITGKSLGLFKYITFMLGNSNNYSLRNEKIVQWCKMTLIHLEWLKNQFYSPTPS